MGPHTRFVIVEGIWLLHDSFRAKEFLSVSVFLDVDDEERVARLVQRRMLAGETRETAEGWAKGSDERNAEQVATTRAAADYILRL